MIKKETPEVLRIFERIRLKRENAVKGGAPIMDLGQNVAQNLESDGAKCPPKNIRNSEELALRAGVTDPIRCDKAGKFQPSVEIKGIKYFGCKPKVKIKANPKSESLPDNATRLPVISPDSENVSKECNIEKLKTTVTPSAPEKCCNSDIASTKSVSSQESKSYIDVVSDLSIKVQSKIDSYYVKKDDKINKNVVNVDKVDVPSEL